MGTIEEKIQKMTEKKRQEQVNRRRELNYIFLIILLGAILVALHFYVSSSNTNSERYVKSICDMEVMELNNELEDASFMVDLLAEHIMDDIDNKNIIKDENKIGKILEKMSFHEKTMLEKIEDAEKIYIRFSPELSGSTSGIVMKRTLDGIKQVEPIDLSSYAAGDMEHVGWYYLTVRKKEALWFEPYEDKILAKKVISYVTPLCLGDKVVGVVGIDLGLDSLTNRVKKVQVLQTGYASLIAKNGENLIEEPQKNKEACFVAKGKLVNDMMLTVSAPKKEVDVLRYSPFYNWGKRILVLLLVGVILYFQVKMIILERKVKKISKEKMKLFRRVLALLIIVLFFAQVFGMMYQMDKRNRDTRKITVADNTYDKTLKVVGDIDFEPYSYVLEDGSYSGHDISLINEIANRLQVNVEITLEKWDQCRLDVCNGEADILLGCEDASLQDTAYIIRSDVIVEDSFVVYGKQKISGIQDMSAKKIGCIKGAKLKDVYELTDDVVLYESCQEELQALETGSVDFAIVRKNVGDMLLAREGYTDLFQVYDLKDSRICLGVNVNNRGLLSRLNKVIDQMDQEGSLDSYYNEWLNSSKKHFYQYEMFKNWSIYYCITGTLLLWLISIFLISFLYDGKNQNLKSKEKMLES